MKIISKCNLHYFSKNKIFSKSLVKDYMFNIVNYDLSKIIDINKIENNTSIVVKYINSNNIKKIKRIDPSLNKTFSITGIISIDIVKIKSSNKTKIITDNFNKHLPNYIVHTNCLETPKITVKFFFPENFEHKKNVKVVAVVPVYGREPLLKYTIRRLIQKNKVDIVIVIGESISEKIIALKEGAIFIQHPNKPLGRKWNAGYSFIKRFNPETALFVGSSDWISDDWLETAYNAIKQDENIGYVGKKGFDMVDFRNKQVRYCKWFGYVDKIRAEETIGIGRLLSKNLLEKINYCPFPENKNYSMDYGMYLLCKKNGFKVKIIENNSIFLSLSTDLWINKHEFDMHYLFSSNSSIPALNNVPEEVKSLYKNGCLYSKDDQQILIKEFPELNEFYDDYLIFSGFISTREKI